MKLSIAITTFNRSELTMESFSKVYDHPLIDEIVIVDDASDWMIQQRLSFLLDFLPYRQKIKLYYNKENLGMSRNKAEAISKCKNEWVIIGDSDNVFPVEYVDAFCDVNVRPKNRIFCPSFAEPEFNFGLLPEIINKDNAGRLIKEKEFRVFLNCCNYVVNRERYLEVYECNPDIKESDTIWFNYLWLKSGGDFRILPGMKYFHRVHKDSGWLANHKKNIEDANRLQKIIAEL